MTLDVNQACAVAAVKLLRESGETFLADRLAGDLLHTDLFIEEPIVQTMVAMAS